MRPSLAVAVLLAAGCVGDPPQQPLVTRGSTVEVTAPATRLPADPNADPATWQRLAQQLESDNRMLTAERDHWKAEAERFEAAHARAVAEINRARGEAAARQYSTRASPPPPRAALAASVSTLGAPQLQIVGDSVTVSVRLWNSGDQPAQGSVEFELLLDGEVVDSATEHLDVPGRTDFSATTTLRGGNRTGTYSARVRLDY